MDEKPTHWPLVPDSAVGSASESLFLAGATCEFGDSTLADAAARVHDRLRAGPGFALLRSFGRTLSTLGTLERLYLDLGNAVGHVVPQSSAGHLLRHVTNEGGHVANVDERRAYGHRGCAAMEPHSDSADYVGLLCVRPALAGGSSAICNSEALHDRIRSERPELLPPLYRGFHFDVSAMATSGDAATSERVPVFSARGRSFSCIFNRERIFVGMKRAGAPMSELEIEAVDYLHGLARSREFLNRVPLQALDLLFLNNHRVLHGRDSFEDGPDGRRLIIRIWINLRERDGLRQIPTC